MSESRWYRGKDVPQRIIRQFARAVVDQFEPELIILFGSHARGNAHSDSDVDILVVMPTRNELDQAARIHLAVLPPFPLHLLVRTPKSLRWRLAEGDSFLKEVVSEGVLLHEKTDEGMGDQGRGRPPGRRYAAAQKAPVS